MNPNIPGHRKLLSEFTTAGNVQMVRYMLGLPGICDPKMDDGTTAFVMSLSRKDVELIEVLLTSEILSDTDQKELGKRAVFELDRNADKRNTKVKRALTNALKQLNVLMEDQPTTKKAISEE